MKDLDTLYKEITLEIRHEISISASVEDAFDGLLEQLNTQLENPEGDPIPMKFEPWPGGRWYRDLGDKNGHLWGHVQVLKRPSLLEISGPLFMSYPVISHVQYKISESKDGSILNFTHKALGFIEASHREGVVSGWKANLEGVRRRAERR